MVIDMKLVDLSVLELLNQVDAPTPTPGGGSVSALVVAEGISLIRMVAHLSMTKKKFKELSSSEKDEYLKAFEELQIIKDKVIHLIDEDTNAYNEIMECFKMPKTTIEEISARTDAINQATIKATIVPFETLKEAFKALQTAAPMFLYSAKSATSDFGVGILLIKAGLEGAYMNVKTNMNGFPDSLVVEKYVIPSDSFKKEANIMTEEVLRQVHLLLG